MIKFLVNLVLETAIYLKLFTYRVPCCVNIECAGLSDNTLLTKIFQIILEQAAHAVHR